MRRKLISHETKYDQLSFKIKENENGNRGACNYALSTTFWGQNISSLEARLAIKVANNKLVKQIRLQSWFRKEP